MLNTREGSYVSTDGYSTKVGRFRQAGDLMIFESSDMPGVLICRLETRPDVGECLTFVSVACCWDHAVLVLEVRAAAHATATRILG